MTSAREWRFPHSPVVAQTFPDDQETQNVPRTHWLMLSLLATAQAGAVDSDTIQVRTNKLQGVMDLAMSYCGGHGESIALQQLLESAGYRSGEPPDVMIRFCSLDRGQNAASYPGRPLAYSGNWSSPWERFLNAAVKSPDLAAFLDETAGAFTFQEQQIIVDALRYMTPIYERLVEAAIGGEATEMGRSLSRYMAKNDVAGLMRSIGHLYGTPWPEGMPLWIGLSPTPPGSPDFSAMANGNVIRSFMPVDFDHPDIYAGVISHEFAHVLYTNMSLERVRALQDAFSASTSPSRRFAEIWLNEALATAAGNGWVSRKLNHADSAGEWYSDPIVDPYAKAISAAVYGAIDSGRTLDGRMVDEFVTGFERAFPDALRNPDVMLPHAAIVSNADAESLSAMRVAYGNRVGIRRLDGVREDSAREVELPPTVLRVHVSESGKAGMDWHRSLLEDGGIEFSTTLGKATDFSDALDTLIIRIRNDDW